NFDETRSNRRTSMGKSNQGRRSSFFGLARILASAPASAKRMANARAQPKRADGVRMPAQQKNRRARIFCLSAQDANGDRDGPLRPLLALLGRYLRRRAGSAGAQSGAARAARMGDRRRAARARRAQWAGPRRRRP